VEGHWRTGLGRDLSEYRHERLSRGFALAGARKVSVMGWLTDSWGCEELGGWAANSPAGCEPGASGIDKHVCGAIAAASRGETICPYRVESSIRELFPVRTCFPLRWTLTPCNGSVTYRLVCAESEKKFTVCRDSLRVAYSLCVMLQFIRIIG
jgi:hypothetical protein